MARTSKPELCNKIRACLRTQEISGKGFRVCFMQVPGSDGGFDDGALSHATQRPCLLCYHDLIHCVLRCPLIALSLGED